MPASRDEQRQSLRRQVIGRRARLDPAAWQAGADALVERLTATPEFEGAGRISAYWPVRGEMDVRPVIEAALAADKAVYLPVLASGSNADEGLLFAPYARDIPMIYDKYGIPEPDVAREQLIAARDLEMAIVPLVLFDDRGHRVGMGGGYYDRAFAFVQDTATTRKPTLVGAAHEFQRVEALTPEPWDVTMDLIVTEDRIRRSNRSETF